MLLKVKQRNFTKSKSVCSLTNCDDGGDCVDARSDISEQGYKRTGCKYAETRANC